MPTIHDLLAKARQTAQNQADAQAAAKATAAQIAAQRPVGPQPAPAEAKPPEAAR